MTNHPNRGRAARNADAGFFEDWAAWSGWLFPQPAQARYQVHAETGLAVDLISRLPGAALQKKHRYDISRALWFVPASSWRRLREAAPIIAADYTARTQRRRTGAAVRKAADIVTERAQRAAEKADWAAATPEIRETCERIDNIADACLRRGLKLTDWEREFISPLIDRVFKYGVAVKVSDKQRAAVDRIYAKIGHL